MASKAERKRKKRGQISLPGGKQVQPRPGPGRPADRPANEVALAARAKMAGIKPRADGLREAARPEYGCAVGRAIMADADLGPYDRAKLWRAVVHTRKVWIAHDKASGAPKRHAQCLAILAPRDQMSADFASPAPDLRTEEEKVRQADRAYMQVRGWLGHCDGAAQSAVVRYVVDEIDAGNIDWPAVKRGLLCVVDGLEGRAVWRGDVRNPENHTA